jgi:hypothetical protein
MSQIEILQDLEGQRAALEKKINAMKEKVHVLSGVVENIKSTATEKNLKLRDIALALCPELNPEGRVRKTASSTPRRPREMKVYRNPKTGAEVQTKGGNHKVLKAWKAEFGADVVEGWLVK